MPTHSFSSSATRKMFSIPSVFFVLACCLPLLTFGWPTGAPNQACGNMEPQHGARPQFGKPPYEIVAKLIGPGT